MTPYSNGIEGAVHTSVGIVYDNAGNVYISRNEDDGTKHTGLVLKNDGTGTLLWSGAIINFDVNIYLFMEQRGKYYFNKRIPTSASTYVVTVSNSKGCTAADVVKVCVMDVR